MQKAAVHIPVHGDDGAQQGFHPIERLRIGINHLFERVMSSWPSVSRDDDTDISYVDNCWGGWLLTPKVEFVETDTGYLITAELAGLSEKDIDVLVKDGILMFKGEKLISRQEKKKDYYLSERRYGAFRRMFTLPYDVDASKISSTLRKGILTIFLPKTDEADKKIRKIKVESR